MNCQNCGGDIDRPWWSPGGCTCKREPQQDDSSILDVAERFDYITPISEVTGVDKYILFVLAMLVAFLVLASHGILWG